MKKKAIFTILLLLLFTLLVSCNNKNDLSNNSSNAEDLDNNLNQNIINNNNSVNVGNSQNEEEIEDTVEEDIEGKVISKLTGQYIDEEVSKIRPIAVMLDNHYGARPQEGLSEADIVYEVLAEGRITRYMAIFQSKNPEEIGPVRSARPYFINLAMSYYPLYVHVGGSVDALVYLKKIEKIGNIDGLTSGKFYRKNHKTIPHNMYIKSAGVREQADEYNYYKEVEFEGLSISNNDNKLDGEDANSIKIVYKEPSNYDSIGYFVEYKYDDDNKNYLRYVNGKEHLDEASEIHLTAKNILIIEATHKVLDSKGRRAVDIIGEGKGKYIYEGKCIDITWNKKDATSKMRYYDLEDNEVILNAGNTYIQVVEGNDGYKIGE